MIVVNSSPIIILAKEGMLDILKKCYKKVIIPKSVYNEVMHKNGTPEAVALQKVIKARWVIVQKTAVMSELDTKNIGQGEKEAISLAYKHKSLLIIDDDSAKKYASVFGVEAHGTLYLIYLACARGIIDKSDAMNALEGMIVDGFYVSSELHMKFLDLLNTLEEY